MSEPKSGNMTIAYAVVNDKGRIRRNNEDNYYVNGLFMQPEDRDGGACFTGICADDAQLFAVCDGMGGTDAGEEAAGCAVSVLAGYQDHIAEMADGDYLTECLRHLSDTVHDEAAESSRNSGTTIAMVVVSDGMAAAANVGDSRVYRCRAGCLEQISLDHSRVQHMITLGLLTPEQARRDPLRHVISQYLGMPKEIPVSPYICRGMPIEKEDIFLLCSDGLTDMVEDREIEEILLRETKPEDAAVALKNAALENGGRDNVTVMVLRAEEASEAASKQPSSDERETKTHQRRSVRRFFGLVR